ncbi:MAG: hypothetical protein R3220_08170 [Balneolaceae bacterium]|nr:hypothetical protein [Balneolaceae bacterium]
MNSTAYVHTLSDKVNNYFTGKRAVFVADDSQNHLAANILEAEVGLRIINIQSQDSIPVEISSNKLPAQYRSREILRKLVRRAMAQTYSTIGIASTAFKGQYSVAPFLSIHS